ncbi:MAG TPA: transposase [Burkholderiales bacterium]|nr:transposase [Burkholderiales bacterium]
MRIIGLDIHRVSAEAVMLDEGKIVRLGRIGMTRHHLEAFARRLKHDDHVVVEATGNASAVVEVISPHVGRVVIANPREVHLIARAKIKTDVIDATVLAKLYASNFLPEVWVPDGSTRALRRQVARRNQIVRQRVRLKTMTQSILHAHLLPRCPHADLFGRRGRGWLVGQAFPRDERDAVERHLREYDRLGEDLRAVERELAQAALGNGRITKQGRNHARSMLVEAAWQAVRGPGPLRGFYERVARRRSNHVAAVAVARKLAVIVWHMLTKAEDYAGVRPALHAKKLRELELRSGQPERRGKRGEAYAYNLTRVRQEERRRAEQSEIAYRRLTEGWTKRKRRVPTDAAKEERLS